MFLDVVNKDMKVSEDEDDRVRRRKEAASLWRPLKGTAEKENKRKSISETIGKSSF